MTCPEGKDIVTEAEENKLSKWLTYTLTHHKQTKKDEAHNTNSFGTKKQKQQHIKRKTGKNLTALKDGVEKIYNACTSFCSAMQGSQLVYSIQQEGLTFE